MQSTAFVSRSWNPARHVPISRSQLGQVPSATILDSPLLSFGTDLVAAAASAYLAYGLGVTRNTCLDWLTSPTSRVVGKDRDGKEIHGSGLSMERALEKCPGTTWITLWWIIATAAGVKALHDLSRMRA